MDEDHVFTVNEISILLRIKPPVIRRLIKSKKLKALKVGGQWRITSVAFQEYLKSSIRT